jgi:UPF0716 protein FxsA
MLSRLLLLFILVPAVELLLLIQMGQWIGTLPTVALIALTGVVGAYLARQQGVQVLRKVQQEIQSGQMPADALLDGAMVLVAGAVLMTPGVLTDALGFLLLIPQSRQLLRKAAWRRIQRMISEGKIQVGGFGPLRTRESRPHTVIIDQEEVE